MENHFEWSEDYSVGVKEIDNQHKHLLFLISELFNSINERAVDKILMEILNKLIDYAELHFKTEEKYFDKFNYEFSDEHELEHRNFEKKMLSLREQCKNKEIEVSFELIDFLEDWLINHLENMDRKYIECFRDNGLS